MHCCIVIRSASANSNMCLSPWFQEGKKLRNLKKNKKKKHKNPIVGPFERTWTRHTWKHAGFPGDGCYGFWWWWWPFSTTHMQLALVLLILITFTHSLLPNKIEVPTILLAVTLLGIEINQFAIKKCSNPLQNTDGAKQSQTSAMKTY